jgi:hypothetical protein
LGIEIGEEAGVIRGVAGAINCAYFLINFD